MELLCSLNGTQMPLSQAKIPVLDRGFLFGDAVYEVTRVYNGRPFLFDEHMSRLAGSVDAMKISGVDLARLRKDTLALIDSAKLPESGLYQQISRGPSTVRSHAFPPGTTPTVFMYLAPFEDRHAAARIPGGSVVTFPDIRWRRCDVKTVNILANVLAAQAAKEKSANEALFIDDSGTVTECSASSAFAVIDGKVRTMALSPRILPSITRALLLKLIKQNGIPLEEKPFALAELKGKSELFVAGTLTEVLPIGKVDGENVGEGKPGPVTLRIVELFRKEVERFIAG